MNSCDLPPAPRYDGSMKERRSAVAPIVASLLTFVALSLAAYVGGYFWLGMGLQNFTSTGEVVRTYRYRWLASAFYPAGYLERRATGRRVIIVGGDGDTFHP